MTTKFLTPLLFIVLSAFCFSAEAQDTDAGLSRPVTPKKTTGSTKPTKSPPSSKPNTPSPPKKVATGKTMVTKKSPVTSKGEKNASANIEVTVNQAGSRIEISRVENGIESNINSAVVSNSLDTVFFGQLKSGDYIVKARKNGFYEAIKRVSVKGGKAFNISIDLKPSAGLLTVSSNVEDTEIEIKGIGIFAEKIEDLVLAPQNYQVYITKDGYEPLVKNADVRLGQTTIVSADMQPIRFERLLQNAESDFQASRYKETISNCRLILERNSDEPRSNLLMGYSYFYTERPRESRFYLARALALQSDVEVPVKIYQKANNSESLTDGVLKINRTTASFSSLKRPELNFTIAASSVSKLDINQDKNNSANGSSPKPDSIEIKASVNNGKKIEKKNLRLFPRQAFARVVAPNKAEIAGCPGCINGGCLCQKEIQAIYELLLNWKSGSYSRQTNNFSAVAFPSSNFIQFDGQFFSANVPDNWQTVDQSNNGVWFAPNGGFFRRGQNPNQYIYAANIGQRDIKLNDLRAESENFYQELLTGNNYLEQQNAPKEIIISGKGALVSSFTGFSVESGAEESVQIYTMFTSEGKLFYLISVSPFNERQKYKSVFRHILDSLIIK